MGRMSELAAEIEQYGKWGFSACEIAEMMELPYDQVEEVLKDVRIDFDQYMMDDNPIEDF
jgi:DNA-directed RNA polymerase specialized sigma24 family protein